MAPITCLSLGEIEAFVAGALPADEHASAAAHIGLCDRCLRTIATLQSNDATVDGVAPSLILKTAAMPTQIGPYQVLEKLGEGGMGSVFTAYHPDLDRKVAIKVLLPQIASAESGTIAHARLIREAQAMAQLDNPHVVAIHDVGSFQNQVYLVMDRVNGLTMSQWLQAAPRSWSEIVGVMVQAGKGLEAAHAAGLVHRDFKPANVLVGNDGRVRVADFGIARRSGTEPAPARAAARAPGDSVSDSSQSGSVLTGIGRVVGTPSYMAPEQFEGVTADARSDQFSFCVSLFEALYKHKPFASSKGLINRFSIKPAPTADSAEPTFIRAAILRGLSVSSSDRFESMGALLAELSRQPLTWRAVAPWAALVATIVVMSGAVFWLTRPAPVPGCSTAERGVGDVWGPPARAAVELGFQATSSLEAAAASSVVVSALDEYGQAWSLQKEQACSAAVGAPIDAAALGELKCLELQRMQYRALIEVLTHVTPEMLSQASSAVASLMPPKRCADPHAIAALPRTPNEPVLRERVQSVRLQIASAQALNVTGLPLRSLEMLRAIQPLAMQLKYLPIEAEVELAVAASHSQLDDGEAATEHFRRAARAAEITGQDAMAASAVASSAFFVSYLGKNEEARLMIEHAEILSERSGRDALVESELENTKALLAAFDGQMEKGLEHQQRAVRLRLEVFGPRHPRTMQFVRNLAQSYLDLCRPEEAIALLEGFNSPIEMRKYPRVHLNGLVRLAEAQIAANHIEAAGATLVLAKPLIAPNDFGTECIWLLMKSALALKNGDPKVALESAYLALAAGESLGHDSPFSVFAKVAVGAALTDSGRANEAVQVIQEALPLHKKLMGDDQIKPLYRELTKAFLAVERWKEAFATVEVTLALQKRSCASPEQRADAEWMMARALIGLKTDLPKARRLAQSARETLSAKLQHRQEVIDIDAFLSGAALR